MMKTVENTPKCAWRRAAEVTNTHIQSGFLGATRRRQRQSVHACVRGAEHHYQNAPAEIRSIQIPD